MWSIVVGAGTGTRFGERKQFLDLAGRSVVDHSITAAATVSDGIVVVVPPDVLHTGAVAGSDEVPVLEVAGGATRAESVRAGLAVVPDDVGFVLVHDAARPLASPSLFEAVVEALAAGAVAVVPVVDVTDTIRRRSGGVVDRSGLVAVQTPQGFDAAVLRSGHSSGGEATDDATLVEVQGHPVTLIDGEVDNVKITHAGDLVVAEALFEGGRT